MRCRQIENLLEAYIEGELPTRVRREVEAHLASCASCQRELALTQRIPQLVGDLPTPPIPDEILVNVLEHVGDEKRPASRWMWLYEQLRTIIQPRKWQVAAALTCVLLFAAWLFGSYYHEHRRESEFSDAQVTAAVEEIHLAVGIVRQAAHNLKSALEEVHNAEAMETAKLTAWNVVAKTNALVNVQLAQGLRRGLAVLAKLPLKGGEKP